MERKKVINNVFDKIPPVCFNEKESSLMYAHFL